MRPSVKGVLLCGIATLAGSFAGCGGGNDSDPCYSLKVAGGNLCQTLPTSVAVLIADNKLCTGTFITARHVITAAHCMPRRGGEVRVAVQGFSRTSKRFAIHPSYRQGGLSPYDVAIVQLDVDANVTPAPLVGSQEVERGDTLIAYGYGLDELGNALPERIEQRESPLKATYLEANAVNEDFIQTVSDGGGDTCQGDSGGPVLLEPDGSDEFGLVAVTSFGPNICAVDSGLPSGNTNLQSESVREFIVKNAPNVRFN
jgi:hypothetical protein